MKKSISDIGSYKSFCSLASKNENIFSSFKRYPEYTDILEHCNYEQGKLYSKWCLNSNNFTLEKLLIAKNNDIVGNAKIEEYPAPIGKISPSSLRYLKVLLELELLFGDLSGKDIVEIGVGYGGQCKLIKETFKVKSYSLVDLEEPLLLAKRYLQDDSLNYMTMEELPSDKKYDLIISNYAFTECNKDVQLEYIQKIIKNSAHGYITFNNISHLFDVKSFSKEELSQFFSFTEMEENPCIFAGNAILIW